MDVDLSGLCEQDDSTHDSFKKVDWKEAISPFGKQRRPNTGAFKLKWLVKYGGIDCYKEKVDISQFQLPIDAVWDNIMLAQRGQGSYGHAKQKVIAAAYLENKGHIVSKEGYEIDDDKPDRRLNSSGWVYNCFEINCQHGRADVGCEHCNTYVECGGILPKKCLSSLGIRVISREGKTAFMESDPPPNRSALQVDRSLTSTSTRRFIVYDKQTVDQQSRVNFYIYEQGNELDKLEF